MAIDEAEKERQEQERLYKREKDLEDEATKSLKRWLRLTVDWKREFPEKLQGKDPTCLDAVDDLMTLDVGILYRRIVEADFDRSLYGWIPRMAAASWGQIGALNAESFCERALRAAGHVLDEGNTLLDNDELEKLVILRMNRSFMQFMRSNHADIVQDSHLNTLVRRGREQDGALERE